MPPTSVAGLCVERALRRQIGISKGSGPGSGRCHRAPTADTGNTSRRENIASHPVFDRRCVFSGDSRPMLQRN